RAQLSKLFWSGTLAWTFIGGHNGWLLATLFRRNSDWHDFFLEPVLCLRLQSALMGCCCHLVLCLAGELIVAANVLSRFNHAARNWVVLTASGLTCLRQTVTQLHVATLHTPADGTVNGVLGARHGLRATRDNQVSCAHSHVCSCGHECLQARTTTPIQLHARYFLAQSRVQRNDATKCWCCTIRARLAQDNVINVLGGDPGALHDGIDHGGSQIFYRNILEYSAVASHWSTQWGAKDNVIIVVVGH